MNTRTIVSPKINGIHSITLNNFNPKTGILTFDVTDFLDRSLEPNGQYKCEVLDYQVYYQVFDNAKHLVNKISSNLDLCKAPPVSSGKIITKDFIAYCVGAEPEAKELWTTKLQLMEAQGLIKFPDPNKPNHLKNLLRICKHVQSGQEFVYLQYAYLEDELNKNTCLAWKNGVTYATSPRARQITITA